MSALRFKGIFWRKIDFFAKIANFSLSRTIDVTGGGELCNVIGNNDARTLKNIEKTKQVP